jgi:GNAT superfamily N-acetyltransferase
MIGYARVGPSEVLGPYSVIVACGREMTARLGLRHWDPPLPLADFRAQAATREVWAVLQDGRLIGTFTIGLTSIPDYPREYFADASPALYLNRLALLPSEQGRGLGRACMGEVERLARRRGARSVRFDAVAAHADLRAFYRKLGYRECGPFHIGEVPVECFEKVLRPASWLR